MSLTADEIMQRIQETGMDMDEFCKKCMIAEGTRSRLQRRMPIFYQIADKIEERLEKLEKGETFRPVVI